MALTSTQKAVLSVLAVVLMLALTAAALGVTKWGFARSAQPETTGGITVVDTAEVKVQPDTAFLTFGVVVRNKDAKYAARINAERSSAVVAAITKAGIPKSDVKTVDYSLQPELDYDKNPPKIVGYTASNSVRLKTKDMGKIGELLDSAIAAGANNVQNISFDVENKQKLREKALGLAVKKAEGKAEAIAEAMGRNLGPAISASESVDFDGGYITNYAAKGIVALADAAEPTPISPGEATVSAQVRVVYSVR